MGRETNRQRREKQAATAREKAAAARAAQARVDQRRRAKAILGSVAAAAVVIVIIAVVAITGGSGKQSAGGNRTKADATLVQNVTHVEQAALDQVGKGTVQFPPKAINDPPLTLNGKPQVFAVLAEFCPYCAAERWPLVIALSKFGTFSNLNTVKSSSTDVDPNTSTFSFYKSSYTSKYISFVPVENEDRTQKPLVSLSSAQNAIFRKYTSGYPFLDFGGKYVITGPSFDPGDLKGMSWQQIAAALKNPTSKAATDILGEANVITAMICKMTNGQPASVCSASGVSKITLPQASA